jgi:hydrogenase nickel incorporation protein HypB
MFQNARHVVMTKTDLLQYVPFDMDRAVANALSVNPRLGVLRLSALAGEGLSDWYDFLRGCTPPVKASK